MAIDTFTGTTTGSPGLDWNTPSAWSTGALPGASDTAVMAVPVESSSAWGSVGSGENDTVTALELQSGFTLSLAANSTLDVQGANTIASSGEILVTTTATFTDDNAGNQDQVFIAGGTFVDANSASQDSIWFTSAGGVAVIDAAFGDFLSGGFVGTVHTLSQGGTLEVVGPAGNAASGASISGDTINFGFGGGVESFAVDLDSTSNLSITISPTNPDEYVVTAAMATIAWAKAASGDFSTATNWKGGVVPDASDEAFLAGDGGAAYTVTLDVGDSQTGGITISRIRSNANATLFLDNTGETSGASDELFTSFNTSGAIDNVGYDIEAFGGTMKGALTNDAYGVVDATGPAALRIDTTASVVNDGIFETEGAGALVIEATTVDNESGTIEGQVTLRRATIEGGALSGRVVGAGSVLDGSTNPVNIGTLTVEAGASLTGEGLITNQGSFIVKGSATMEGALDDNGGRIETAGGKLTVEGALSGDSDAIIDGGTMTFAASVSGTVIFEGSGELVLGQAENALFNCRGFATDGQTSLDLEDVGFAGADEITSEITDNEAILMVKGANRTVQFTLVGDYLGVTFTAKSANGGAGSIITASQTTEAAKFVQAAAAFTTTGTSATATHGVTTPQSPSLFNLASGHG